VKRHDAGFYLWAGVPQRPGDKAADDVAFALDLLAQYNVAVLPGSLLAREAHGHNPGAGRIRMALVAHPDECLEAARRLHAFTSSWHGREHTCHTSSKT
jgi:N-succinyldiaminopimelate aminotransferase